jgi:8-oxo-dGTP diphosphatase
MNYTDTQYASEEEFLADYDLSRFPLKGYCVDLTVFTIIKEELCVLLIVRGEHPYKGMWALPGGFVNNSESVDDAASRELKEETNLDLSVGGHLEQLKTYAYPERDPRGYIVTTAYVALVPKVDSPVAGDDATHAKFIPVREAVTLTLATNHQEIIQDALTRIRSRIEYTPIAPKFLNSKTFTIPELARVYEIVWDKKIVLQNFRRKVLSVKGWLEDTGSLKKSGFSGGRLSKVYKASDIEEIYPPLRQPKD